MNEWRRLLAASVAMAAVGGCAFGRKPYADDPLIRSQRAVWGDREKARDPAVAPDPEPIIPAAPAADLVGSAKP